MKEKFFCLITFKSCTQGILTTEFLLPKIKE